MALFPLLFFSQTLECARLRERNFLSSSGWIQHPPLAKPTGIGKTAAKILISSVLEKKEKEKEKRKRAVNSLPRTAIDRTSPDISHSESGCMRRVEILSAKDPGGGIHCAAQKLEASGGERHRHGRNFNDDFEPLSVW